MALAQIARNDNGNHPNPYQDVSSWWSAFFTGGYSWRWFTSPQLYFRPNLEYIPGPAPFTVIDGLGREKTFDKPFDCYIDPFTGKIETLYVQAPESICQLSATSPNATWKRTPIRNVTPIALRIANLPFRFIPAERRGDRSRFMAEDWLMVIGMWIPTLAVFLLSVMTIDDSAPVEKDQTKYLPLMYRGLRYPRMARNILENREQVARLLYNYAPGNTTTALSLYRKFRPRFLNYLVETERNGRKTYECERHPVGVKDLTPFVMVCYSSAHYHIPDESQAGPGIDNDDLNALLALATKAAVEHFKPLPSDLRRDRRAFWIAANCIPPDIDVDDNGNTRHVEGPDKEDLANRDTYSISDIIRTAQHVIVVAGNARRPWDDRALYIWGQRVWTLPEIVLSKGDTVTVVHCGMKTDSSPRLEVHKISKEMFPTWAWEDYFTSRQLIEHYGTLHLSRLELVKISLECLMSRKFKAKHPGDRVYVLMGLLRIRPPIDKTDSAFQAFARLSLPQDSDRLMERLICLLPDTPDQNWELMRDQYKASLWDIYPDTQVCGIGENDTVIVDGAKGAQIQWSGFTPVRSLRKLTIKRILFLFFLTWSPLLFFVGVIMAAVAAPPPGYEAYGTPPNPIYQSGVAILVITLLLFILPAPYFLWHLHSGKLWEVEPCFFGLEGYVPIEAIEEKLFGTPGKHGGRLRWSAYGSPLSRHIQGQPKHERAVRYRYHDGNDNDRNPLFPPPLSPPPQVVDITPVDTYPVETIDPTSRCAACAPNGVGAMYCHYHPTVASCQDVSRSPMGHMKVFTLVDTFNMTVTLFYAVRPPTVLVVGGSEGGMKRAIACSLDVTTGTLYRETVLRIPSQSVNRMEGLPRVRLGLRWPFLEGDVRRTGWGGGDWGPVQGNMAPA
ncbi:Heterokaryon incompatibility domain-containing protein (Fragment) [Madurella fahalii]|uniref:Heterokaryon incompatibility domain-containing protein n=1 Tax=Madurella fahalii TaxID=1157608 RepID=A0ABQ0GCM5_9PEZI